MGKIYPITTVVLMFIIVGLLFGTTPKQTAYLPASITNTEPSQVECAHTFQPRASLKCKQDGGWSCSIEDMESIAGIGRIEGNSMEPVLAAGDFVMYEQGQVEKCDIVYFERDGVGIAHRVIQFGKSCTVTKGDNNDAPDAVCMPLDKIKGRVTMVIKGANKNATLTKVTKG